MPSPTIKDTSCPSRTSVEHFRSCLLLFHLFSVFHTLVATQRRRCLLRSVWVNVMPDGCSLISGIGFRIELCCFYHPLAWPRCFFPCVLVLLIFRGHTHDDTQDVIVHLISQSWWRSHFFVFFVLFWFCCILVFFVCLCNFCACFGLF